MPSDQEQLTTIRSQSLQQIADLRANPKPNYNIDGQQVSWESYLGSLERTVDWCDVKLAGEDSFEFQTLGGS